MWDNPGDELDPAGCTSVSPPQRGGAVPAPILRGRPKWRDKFPEVSDHSVDPPIVWKPKRRCRALGMTKKKGLHIDEDIEAYLLHNTIYQH